MTRLSAAKRRAQVPSHDIRAVPELRAAAPAPTAPPTQVAMPPAKQASDVPTAAPTVAPTDDDQLARLLAAKQRARKKRDG
jgi:hypothetical protein